MAATAHSLILTAHSATASSFPHRNPLFLASRRRRLPSDVKSLTLRSTVRVPSLFRACAQSHQIDDSGSGSKAAKGVSWVEAILRFARSNVLPLALISAVTLGLTYPSLGCAVDKYHMSKIGPFGIFVISGLVLRSEEIGAAVEAWPVGLFGLVSILFLTPYFSRIILQVQLQPQEFITGLAIFSCMPTTLSSGVALTQLAGANTALALAMTVISNLLGILIVPFSITKFVASGVGVTLPTKQLFKSLVLTILFPLILGKFNFVFAIVAIPLYRFSILGNRCFATLSGINNIAYEVLRESFKGVADFVDRNRKLFSGISAFFLSLVPWTQVSKSRSLLLMVKPRVFLVAIGLGALLHLSLLVFNSIAVRSLSIISGGTKSTFSREENANALILVASQKTLPVMVAVIEPLCGAFGESGLLVLPCIATHLIQIIVDSFLVNFMRRKDNPNNVKVA